MIQGKTSRSVMTLLLVLTAATAARGQEGSAVEASIPMDTAALMEGPHVTMRMLYERTLFAVDVLWLTVQLGPEDAKRIEALAQGQEYSKQLADSIAQVAIHSRNAFVRSDFQRDVSQDQFFDGVRDNMEKAMDAGIVDRATYVMISNGLPVWYDFLAERGIRDGDQILYRIVGDTLRTQFVGFDGEVLRDQTDVGPERRLSVLGSYFARNSNFREKLIKSLFTEDR